MENKNEIPLDDLTLQYKSYKKEFDAIFQDVASNAAFIKGTALTEFENAFAKFCEAKYCIGVASGTDALHISLLALGIKSGDEVIIPANSFVATAYAAHYVGAKPVFVDANPLSYNIDVDLIERAITKKTKAIIPVHLYGNPAEMNRIRTIAKKYKLFVIEDAAQAHGVTYNRKKVGSLGNVAAFSFYPSKNLGAFGDGGAITTNSKRLAEKIKLLREYGGKTKYIYQTIGYNSRLDALQARILRMKLQHLPEWNKKRKKLAEYYTENLKEIPMITTPSLSETRNSIFHLYVIQANKRDALAEYLKKNGIQSGIHYPLPLHLQPSLKYLGYKKGNFPVAEHLSKHLLSLPMFPALTTKQQNYIISTIKAFYEK